jgi:hypothetical protein
VNAADERGKCAMSRARAVSGLHNCIAGSFFEPKSNFSERVQIAIAEVIILDTDDATVTLQIRPRQRIPYG